MPIRKLLTTRRESQFGQFKAKQIITLRNIPFGEAGVADRVFELCTPFAGITKCEFDENGRITLWDFKFGNLGTPSAIVDDDGFLIEFYANGTPEELEGTAELLTEKYGNPAAVKEEVRNGLGHELTKTTYWWTDAKGTRLMIETMTTRTDFGQLTILSSKELARRERANKEYRKTLKDSL